mmetsp:Transcript_2241/g.3090  ORF Transcript_2241/g.3090 Transcript_2241/m.3090 type:complete len:118 (-) Transcript_2241:738-1091(-)
MTWAILSLSLSGSQNRLACGHSRGGTPPDMAESDARRAEAPLAGADCGLDAIVSTLSFGSKVLPPTDSCFLVASWSLDLERCDWLVHTFLPPTPEEEATAPPLLPEGGGPVTTGPFT